jgi:nitrogen fixation NifU-like protein
MSVSEEDLYNEHVMDHYHDPFHLGPCPHCTHAHQDDSPLCGDAIRIELKIEPSEQISDAYFTDLKPVLMENKNEKSCCISRAAASMLVEYMEGKSVAEARQFTAEDMLKLFGPKLTPNRQKCCLLSWRVLQSALFSPLEPPAHEHP